MIGFPLDLETNGFKKRRKRRDATVVDVTTTFVGAELAAFGGAEKKTECAFELMLGISPLMKSHNVKSM